MTNNSDNALKRDLFAEIAGRRREVTDSSLVEPQPPTLPQRFLPAARSNPKAAFRPPDKLDSPEKLQDELARQRERMAPFLSDLAPPLPSSRVAVRIEEFDWRMQTDADLQDFIGTLNGAGEWQRVRIPDYGGPVGRAVAYYRTTFLVTEEMKAKGALFVCFKGVDYKAHVFVNGAFLGSHEGFFAPFEFEFTSVAHVGENVLLVTVENDATPHGVSWGAKVDGDKIYAASGLGWDDPERGWHHCPPGMGICQDVTAEARPPLHLHDVFVRPLLDEQQAEVWVEVFNSTREPQQVSFSVSLFGQNFEQVLFRDRIFQPPQSAGGWVSCFRFAVDVPNPRVWGLDTPWLYQIQVSLPNGDAMARQFGMRSFKMDTEHKPYGRLFLNGREIRLRGANTMGFEQQDVFKKDFAQLRDDVLLAKICHMNFWRLTQRPVQAEVYTMCDRLGFMTQTDLPLFAHLPRRQFCEAVRQAEEMERLVRGHACNIMISYINEPYPAAWGNETHRHCTRPELEQFFEAAGDAVRLANPDRVIKPVDGDYDPPAPSLTDTHCYTCWYNGHGVEFGKLHRGFWQRVKPDWFYGCGEFGTEGLDPVPVMRKYYPKHWLPQSTDEEASWSPNQIKEAQTGQLHYVFFEAAHTLDGWVAASQHHQAWATRMMTEAFRRDNHMNSFAIHLFIDAFPDGWMKAIMDVDRGPKPAYFAYREALTPLMANIRADRLAYVAGEEMRFEFWVCNDTQEIPPGAQLRYQLEVGGKVVFAQQTRARIGRCCSTFQGYLRLNAPMVDTRCKALLRLGLALADGSVAHDTAVEIELFQVAPAFAPRDAVVLGAEDGKAAQLARELGLRPADSAELYLVDDFTRFSERRHDVEEAARQGATVLFLELPTGEYEIGGSTVKVESFGKDGRHFVSRDTGHPLVAGFQPEDFRLWFDPAVDRISPILATTFTAEGWAPILTSGPALAAAECCHGDGVFRVCQVQLSGRTTHNPVAALFAQRLTAADGGDPGDNPAHRVQ